MTDHPAPTLPYIVRADTLSFLRRAARVAPERIAVASPAGQVSYSQLLGRVQALAARLPVLPETGLGEPIAVVAENDWEVVELYLGVMAGGHAVLPISSRLPEEAIARIVAKAGARLGLLAPSAAPRLKRIAAAADRTRWLVHGVADCGASLPARTKQLPAGTAMVCFTSGTTGEPKGVIITHTNLVVHGLTSALVFRMKDGSVHVNPMPLAHFAGASRVISTLVTAGTHVILPGFEPQALFEAMARWRGTHTMAVPTMARDLLECGPERFDLASLEVLIVGAAPTPMPLARELVARLKCGLFNGYGSTESSALAVCLTPEQHLQAVAEGDEQLLGSVGRAVPGIELKILDQDNIEVPPGESGQIALRGAKISPGYLDNPAETRAKFLPQGWLLTGDLGRLLPGDNLQILGRIDEMIVSGGLNVQPAEIETEAVRFAGVAECAAFAVKNERWGQEVRLAVVPAKGTALSPEALRGFLRTRLDPYKLPKKIHVFDRLPRTNVGKVQRYRLAEVCKLIEQDSAGEFPVC